MVPVDKWIWRFCMHITAIALSVLLAAAFLAIGGPKVLALESAVQRSKEMGLGTGIMRLIGALEVAAAAGLVIGIWVPWLGIAAASGLVLLMLSALAFHVRRHDPAKYLAPPVVLLVVAAAAGLFTLLSM
jgi:DoxX-like family